MELKGISLDTLFRLMWINSAIFYCLLLKSTFEDVSVHNNSEFCCENLS